MAEQAKVTIRTVDPTKIDWIKTGNTTQYSPVYERIRSMQIGEAIEVDLSEPRKNFNCTIFQSFRKSRVDYSVRCMRLDKEGKRWIFQKKERKK